MKRLILKVLLVGFVISIIGLWWSCGNSDNIQQIKQEVTQIINEYYPAPNRYNQETGTLQNYRLDIYVFFDEWTGETMLSIDCSYDDGYDKQFVIRRESNSEYTNNAYSLTELKGIEGVQFSWEG